jgi:porin
MQARWNATLAFALAFGSALPAGAEDNEPKTKSSDTAAATTSADTATPADAPPSAEASAPKTEAEAKPKPKGKLSILSVIPSFTFVSDYKGDMWNRAAAMGTWGGARQKLLEHGFSLDFYFNQFMSGVLSGGTESSTSPLATPGRNVYYAGLFDALLALDSGRLGIWPGGLAEVHFQSKWGQSGILSDPGTIIPPNLDLTLPSTANTDAFLTEYWYMHLIAKAKMSLLFGRVSWTRLADENTFASSPFQFLNIAIRNTPFLGYFTAFSSHGGVVIIEPHEHVGIQLLAIAQNDQDGVWGSPGGFFSEVTAAIQMELGWKPKGLRGVVRPIAAWGSKDPADLSNPFLLPAIVAGVEVPSANNNWTIGLNFEQFLFRKESANPHILPTLHKTEFRATEQGFGLFARGTYAPKNRNPWNGYVTFGLSGRGLIPNRPNDRYGGGFYTFIVSSDLQDQPVIGRLGTEYGGEIFYNYAITSWLFLTADWQYTKSGLPGVKDAQVFQFRLQTTL